MTRIERSEDSPAESHSVNFRSASTILHDSAAWLFQFNGKLVSLTGEIRHSYNVIRSEGWQPRLFL